MSTTEAKQAAEKWGKSGFSQRERDIFAEGYAAATAKLREELKLTDAARNFWENRAVTAEQQLAYQQSIRDFDKLSPQSQQAIAELITAVELFSSMFKSNERET